MLSDSWFFLVYLYFASLFMSAFATIKTSFQQELRSQIIIGMYRPVCFTFELLRMINRPSSPSHVSSC